MNPGRTCPPRYGYPPRVFARTPDCAADTLYVIGGLYGNGPALDEIERMAAAEAAAGTLPQLVFNGDFHWFDATPSAFDRIQARIAAPGRIALRGNVETEVAGDDDGAGCGCAYPDSVPDADVERSNAILRRLRGAAGPAARAHLATLPMHALVQVGAARIGIVHGDAWSLAGWRFGTEALFDATAQASLQRGFEQAEVDGFASTHTCLPALHTLDADGRERFVINNGAAGMPNFEGERGGLITRIATAPLPVALASCRAYGADLAGVYVDALHVRFDAAAWLAEFLALWPAGSDAHRSYFRRIVDGPRFTVDDALGRGPNPGCVALAA